MYTACSVEHLAPFTRVPDHKPAGCSKLTLARSWTPPPSNTADRIPHTTKKHFLPSLHSPIPPIHIVVMRPLHTNNTPPMSHATARGHLLSCRVGALPLGLSNPPFPFLAPASEELTLLSPNILPPSSLLLGHRHNSLNFFFQEFSTLLASAKPTMEAPLPMPSLRDAPASAVPRQALLICNRLRNCWDPAARERA